MGSAPRNLELTIRNAAYAHIQRAKKLGKSLDERLKIKREVAEDWQPDDAFRRDFEMVSQTIKECGATILRADEASKKKLGGMSESELKKVMKEEVFQVVGSLTEDEWQELCRERVRRFKS